MIKKGMSTEPVNTKRIEEIEIKNKSRTLKDQPNGEGY